MKPRKFWIYEDNGDMWVSELDWKYQNPKAIRVIEKNAYDELQKRCESLKEALKSIQEKSRAYADSTYLISTQALAEYKQWRNG